MHGGRRRRGHRVPAAAARLGDEQRQVGRPTWAGTSPPRAFLERVRKEVGAATRGFCLQMDTAERGALPLLARRTATTLCANSVLAIGGKRSAFDYPRRPRAAATASTARSQAGTASTARTSTARRPMLGAARQETKPTRFGLVGVGKVLKGGVPGYPQRGESEALPHGQRAPQRRRGRTRVSANRLCAVPVRVRRRVL